MLQASLNAYKSIANKILTSTTRIMTLTFKVQKMLGWRADLIQPEVNYRIRLGW